MSFSPRRLIADIGIYGLGDILLKASAFITLPIYTRIFTPQDYGLWSFVISAAGIFNGIAVLGGDSAYARYFFQSQKLLWRQLVTSTWLAFLAGWSLVLVALVLPFVRGLSAWSFGTPRYAGLFAVALMSTPVTLINGMCGQALRNQFRPAWFTSLNVATTAAGIGFSLLGVLVLGLGIIGLLIGPLAAALLMLPVRLWTVRSLLRPIFSWRLLRRLLAYGGPLVPVTLAYWVFSSSDRVVLGKLSSVEQLGLYSVAANLTSVLGLVNGALGQAWSPHVVNEYERDRAAAATLVGRTMTYLLAGFGLLCVGLAAFARELLTVLTPPSFHSAALAMAPLALGYLAYASTQLTASGISLKKRTGYFALYASIAAALNLSLNLLLVPRWGMLAAAWSTAVAYGFLTLAYLVTSQRLWPVAYQGRRAVGALALTVAFTIGAMFLPPLGLVLAVLLKSGYCLAFASLLLLTGVVRSHELAVVRPGARASGVAEAASARGASA